MDPGGTAQRTPEPNREELQQLQQALNTTDLGVVLATSADLVTRGGALTYTLVANNIGPNPASQVEVIVNLPAAVSYQSDSGGCKESAGSLTCDLGEILAREKRQFTVTVQVGASREVERLATSATIRNLAGPDPKPENNRTTVETRVT
jgi:uncharacterized repeat protein (TIGR01451 family)